MGQERGVRNGQRAAFSVWRSGEAVHKDKGAGVVVDAVPVATVGQSEQTVLHDSAAIGHPEYAAQRDGHLGLEAQPADPSAPSPAPPEQVAPIAAAVTPAASKKR